MKTYKILFLLLVIAFAACKKYEELPHIKDASFIRIFNSLPNTIDVLHSGQASPFLTFLMDPKSDNEGIPTDGAIVGDFLGTRQLYSLSYPINEANNGVGNTLPDGTINLNPVNYEYPGNEHVLAAPAINGFELSSWAQISSGKHRIMFTTRPLNNTPFKQLSSTIRGRILLDTTITFEAGEVYTMEVISRDLDNNRYGLYVRKEQFIHQSFEDNKIYVGFINLSGKQPLEAKYGFSTIFPDKVNINYSYNIYDDVLSNESGTKIYNPLPGYNNTYYTTLNTIMDTRIPYLALPLLPESSFFRQDTLRSYADQRTILTRTNGYGEGSLPYFSFSFVDANKPVTVFNLKCAADPDVFNNLNVNIPNVRNYAPNLNLLVNTGNAYHAYSSLNIMEIIYDRVYMMQVQRGFNEVPKN